VLKDIAPSFKFLERLFAGFDTRLISVSCPFEDDDQTIEAVQSFHPLKFLQVRGLRSVLSLYHLLNRHGKSLRGLATQSSPAVRDDKGAEHYYGYKYPYLGIQAINKLADLCPDLEELRVQIKRSAGSAVECAMY
jgi:hypothetical protein